MSQTPDHVRDAYDAVAAPYADRFCGELEHKPLDRDLLRRFADEVRGRSPVYDLGCGPGQTTAFLHAHGVSVTGIDLSAALIQEARRRNPEIHFQQGDMLALSVADASAAGLVAFYAIVHFSRDQLAIALAEMRRVLLPGAPLLLAFHVGNETVHVHEFLGRSVSLDFVFFPSEEVAAALRTAGFGGIEITERDPYPGVEFPSRRAYIRARAISAGS
jgi:SAM-dependent methyltransferase